MVEYGMLIDTSLCIGCRGCQVSCKQWNAMPAEITVNMGNYKNPPDLTYHTWTLLDFQEYADVAGRVHWVFRKEQCRHCVNPGCLNACPVPDAIVKDGSGAVVVNQNLCGDCDTECYDGCPWRIPRFRGYQYDAPDKNRPNWIREAWKCWMCRDRISQGRPTACSQTCAPGAVKTYNKTSLMAVALDRVAALKNPATPPTYPEANIWPPAGYETNVIWILTEKPENFKVGLPENTKAMPAIAGDATVSLAAAGAVGALAVAAAQKFAERVENVKKTEGK